MHRIWTNHLFTRRKTFFYVESPMGEIIYRHRWFWPCVEYLDLLGVEEYEIVAANQQSEQVNTLIARKKD